MERPTKQDAVDTLRVITQLEELIQTWKGFSRLKSAWGATGREELRSLAGEIYAAYRNDSLAGKCPNLARLITLGISEALQLTKDPSCDYASVPFKDEIYLNQEAIPAKAEIQDKIAEEVRQSHSATVRTLAKGRRDLVKHIPFEVFERICKESAANTISVYQFAKENDIPYRRLLSTLKRISYQFLKINHSRQPNLVDRRNLAIWLPKIRQLWEYENRFRSWIDCLSKKGWSKSRVSHFMHRKINKNIVPKWYFYIVPPIKKSLLSVLETKKGRVKFPDNIDSLAPIKIPTHKELKKIIAGN